MKILIALFVTLSLAACIPQAKINSPKTSTGSGSSGQSASDAFIGQVTLPPNNDTTGTGSGTVSVPTPAPTPQPTPSLTEYCGKLYISKTGYTIFINEDEQYRIIDPETYNAQQVVNNITFPNDAFDACVHGTLTSGWPVSIIQAEYIQLSDIIDNPERAELKSSYSHEVCGTIMFKTDAGQATPWIQIKVGTSYKIVEDTNDTIKDYLDAHGNTDGCLYNNNGFTNKFNITYKQYFKPTESNLGW